MSINGAAAFCRFLPVDFFTVSFFRAVRPLCAVSLKSGLTFENFLCLISQEMYALKHCFRNVCLKHSLGGLPVYKRRLTAAQTPFGDSTAVAFFVTGFAWTLLPHAVCPLRASLSRLSAYLAIGRPTSTGIGHIFPQTCGAYISA